MVSGHVMLMLQQALASQRQLLLVTKMEMVGWRTFTMGTLVEPFKIWLGVTLSGSALHGSDSVEAT